MAREDMDTAERQLFADRLRVAADHLTAAAGILGGAAWSISEDLRGMSMTVCAERDEIDRCAVRVRGWAATEQSTIERDKP